MFSFFICLFTGRFLNFFGGANYISTSSFLIGPSRVKALCTLQITVVMFMRLLITVVPLGFKSIEDVTRIEEKKHVVQKAERIAWLFALLSDLDPMVVRITYTRQRHELPACSII